MKPTEAPFAEERPGELHSLFGEILDWMLAPLLFLWPISIVATNHVANQIADLPYDRQLGERVVAIVRQVETHGPRVTVNLPRPARDMLRGDEEDRTYFQVLDPRGELLAGDREIPRVDVDADPGDPARPLRFRDEFIRGTEVRVAYQFLPAGNERPPALVQVAETRHKREQLASRIISGVLLPQFAILPLVVILVWLGLTRGLAPLKRLQQRIRARRPDDLSPVNLRNVPEELRPMVAVFNEMMARLEDNLAAQQRFISAAAHQLKTPLTGLKMQTELALGETDCAQLHEYLQRIATGVDRAAHLTYQLLQLARAEASHERAQAIEPVDVGALAREVTAHCVPRALARGIDLGFEGTPGGPVMPGVPLLLREMFDNLIDNAIKYTPAGGRVTVRLRAEPGWMLEIEDTGVGIQREERPLIFERFYRALGSEMEGSGLGLAIVREIADLHRVRIDVLDNPAGVGTLIRLVLDDAGAGMRVEEAE
ncbi:MAG: sensor histidine kinase N-terminal domain-containing protein [Pseudomonadota bacterium]